MKTLLAATLATLVAAMPASANQHAPTRDVCQARAVQASGLAVAPETAPRRKSGISLSGSAQLGIAYSNGALTSAGTDSDGYERLEEQANAKYTRIYNACMQGR